VSRLFVFFINVKVFAAIRALLLGIVAGRDKFPTPQIGVPWDQRLTHLVPYTTNAPFRIRQKGPQTRW
jgi:hypothetical protein